MFLQEIVRALERIERNQALILERLAELDLAALKDKTGNAEKAPDEWMQQGIDNIMNYQAGKKREDSQ